MYVHHSHVRMHDTDAAGILFFAHQLRIAHVAFEKFLDSVGLGLRRMLEHSDYRMPIVHADSDYRAPLRIGDPLRIEVRAERIGNTSFTIAYSIFSADNRLVGSVRTVQVTVNRDTWTKRTIPDELRKALETHLG